MEKDYIDIVATSSDMKVFQFSVRRDTWECFCEHELTYSESGTCFLPGIDAGGNTCFVDMRKLVSFSFFDPAADKAIQKKKKVPKGIKKLEKPPRE